MNKVTCVAGSLAAVSATMPGGIMGGVSYPFGTTFPMLGTQIHSGNTWEGAVYYGTTMKFNPGMFVSYTNSYNVPVYPPPTTPPPTDQAAQVPTFPTVQTPTMAPTTSMEGSYCTAFSSASACPANHYCQPKPGYNPYQVGACMKQTVNTPHNGGGNDYDYKGPDGLEPEINTRGGSCAPPSACGFQSVTGSCYCDLECETNGDCCFDFDAQMCREEEVVTQNTIEDIFDGHSFLKPICPGNCGKTTQFKSEAGKKCFCDPVCLQWDDCCHDFVSTCGSS